MIGDGLMYAPKNQKTIRLAMTTLDGDLGRKVFTEIRAAKKKSTSQSAAKEIRKRIMAAEKQ